MLWAMWIIVVLLAVFLAVFWVLFLGMGDQLEEIQRLHNRTHELLVELQERK